MARLPSASLLLSGRAGNADRERQPPWPGGAAAAIATGMSALELGSDLGGSIRWPAHCRGIFGLKTTLNLVSSYGQIPPMPELRLERNPELLVAGPLGRRPCFRPRRLGRATRPLDVGGGSRFTP